MTDLYQDSSAGTGERVADLTGGAIYYDGVVEFR